MLAASAAYRIVATRRAVAQYTPAGRFLNVDGVRLHYVEQGGGPPVLFFHGDPGFVQDWSAVMPIVARDHRAIAIDRAGHGFSDRPSAAGMTAEDHARLMHDAARELGLACPVLVGHSWGAGLALLYAETYPADVCGVIVVGPRAFRDERSAPLYTTLRLPILGPLILFVMPPQVARSLVTSGLTKAFGPEPVQPAYLAEAQAFWSRTSQVTAMLWDGRNLNMALDAISSRYGQLQVPLTILAGSDDAERPAAERLHAAVPRSRLQILGGVGHELPRTHPETVASALADFPRP